LISAWQVVVDKLEKLEMYGTQLTMNIEDSEVSVEDVVSNAYKAEVSNSPLESILKTTSYVYILSFHHSLILPYACHRQ
jgi:hypothetical protein